MDMSQFKFSTEKGLLVPSGMATGDEREVTLTMPLAVLQALYDFLGALATEDMGVILGRWAGMTPEIATDINRKLTDVYQSLLKDGMRHRFRENKEPSSWQMSRLMGWDQVKR